MHEAIRAYSQLPRKELTVPVRLEWGRALLDVGDRFGAASQATRVLESEPQNSEALGIRRKVLQMEEADRRT